MAVLAREDGPKLSVRERNKLRTRRELLDAALEVFAEVGYGSASVEKIAERAGAAKATVYSYFPQGREQLYCELYEEINNELIEKAAEIYASDGDFSSRIVAVTSAIVDVAQRPRLGRFYAIDDPALDQALPPVRGRASSVIAQYIAKDYSAGAAKGAGRSEALKAAKPEAIARLITGSMTAALTGVARGTYKADEILQAMQALALGLVSHAEPASEKN